MIILDKEKYIAKGSQRRIFLLPSDNTKCIKITLLEDLEKVKNKSKRWYKKLRPATQFSENLKEIKFYNSIKNKDNSIYDCLPKYYGEIKTNIGNGMIVDYIDNSIPLRQYIRENGISNELLETIKYTLNTLYKNMIYIRDQHTENYVIQKKDGKLKMFLIDGLGNATLIQFFNEIPFIKKHSIISKMKVLMRNLTRDFPQYSEFFKLENFIKK